MSDTTIAAKRIPKYISIADSLRSEMECGLLAPGDQLPSFANMTLQFNVTKNTIDKAHRILELEGLVRREQGRGIFVEPQRSNKTGNIGLLRGTTFTDFYTDDLIAGIQGQAREADLKVMLVDEQRPVDAGNIDGILLFCSAVEVAKLDLPVALPRVLMLEPVFDGTVCNVVADDFNGAKTATLHLLELGHRRISLMLAAEEDPYAVRRLAGYRAALEEFDVEFDDRLCFTVDKIESSESNYLYAEEYMNEWLATGWKDLHSTAILATHDTGAVGTIKVLTANGFEVPRQVSVMGFDGTRLSDLSTPRLTTIKVPLREIGMRAMKLLVQQMQGGLDKPEEVILPVELKAGASTAPIPSSN